MTFIENLRRDTGTFYTGTQDQNLFQGFRMQGCGFTWIIINAK